DRGLVQRGLSVLEQSGRLVTVAARERDGGLVEAGHCRLIRVVPGTDGGTLGETALRLRDVATVDLDVPEIVQLHSDPSAVAEAPVECQAFCIQVDGPGVVAGEPRSGGKQVQGRRAGCLAQIARELARLGRERLNARLVAVAQGHTAEPNERKRLGLSVATARATSSACSFR